MITHIARDALHDKLASGDPPVVIEVLGAAYFADAHLPGALNIPPGQVDRLAPGLLPDLEVDIVVYSSATSRNAEAAANRLRELGYQRVAIYDGGKEDWIEHGLAVERDADIAAGNTKGAPCNEPQR